MKKNKSPNSKIYHKSIKENNFKNYKNKDRKNKKNNKYLNTEVNTNKLNTKKESLKQNQVNDYKKEIWKPGNMVYPLPAVMVSCGNKEESNIITIAWTGTICTNPPMLYISVRPERYSYNIIKETKEFVINLTTKFLVKETDFCGVKSGKDLDKWQETGLTKGKSNSLTYAPIIKESPVNIECKVSEILPLGSHHMFIAEVTSVQVSKEFLDEKGKFHLNSSNLLAYSHGSYLELGKTLGTFGYSIMKPKTKIRKEQKKSK